MAENNNYDRRRRNAQNNSRQRNEDFDWDRYDAQTSYSSYNNNRYYEEDYGTPTPSRKNKPAQKRKKKRKKQLTQKQIIRRRRVRVAILLIILIGCVILSGIGIGMYAAVSREIKDMNIQNLALNYSSFIYYNDEYGNVQQLEQIQSVSNRIWVDSDNISPYLKDAIVSIEDERFYSHHGVDIKRTMGATVKWALAKVGIGSSDYGGSTITQQVIKNITNEKENKASRKIKEMMRAITLERELSKDDILTMYLNIVYFSNNCYGVEAAAQTYFNKSASEVTLEEAASIAGITQYPSLYDPFAHPDKNEEKRNLVLSKMLELGKITQDEFNTAASSKLNTSTAYADSQSQISSYFVDQVINDVISDLQTQKGYSEDFATRQVYNGGLKIYTTVDMNIQNIIEKVYADEDNFPDLGEKAQSAMILMDPYTGAIKGMVGGVGVKTDVRGWNRATQAVRQPGSAIKPLSVYSPALDTGKITESTIVTDEEITIGDHGDDAWTPKNSYNDFYGDMSIREAVARSANIPAVKVLDMVGLSTSFGYLQNKFHISTLNDGDKNFSSLALGGLTHGVTLRDMVGAYSTFVNSGKYIKPYTYTQVLDSNGKLLLQNNANPSQAISAAAAYITSDLLYSVVNDSEGTARKAKLDSGMPVYGKTGTTDDDFDKWFIGYTPYYVCGAWYGFDEPKSITKAGVSGNPNIYLWREVMEQIHEGLPEKELVRPANIVDVEICDKSGLLASYSCETHTGYFVEGTQPKSYCDETHSGHGQNSSGNYYKKSATATPNTTIGPSSSVPPLASSTPSSTVSGGTSTGNSNSSGIGSSSGTGSSSGSSSSSVSTSGGTSSGIGNGSSSSSNSSSGTSGSVSDSGASSSSSVGPGSSSGMGSSENYGEIGSGNSEDYSGGSSSYDDNASEDSQGSTSIREMD